MLSTAIRGWLLVLVCMACVAAGCCKNNRDEGEVEPGEAAAPGLDEPSDFESGSKVDRTIKCYNAATRINKSANYYFRRLRGGKPRAGRTPSVLFKPTGNATKLCQEAKADLTPPMPEIDGLMPEYVDSVANLTEQLNAMNQYYKSKAYETDKYKKGREMHDVFEKDFEAFDKLHRQLTVAIDAVVDERDNSLIRREAKKMGLRYYSLAFQRDAKQLSRELGKDKPDKQRFAELRASVEASYTAFTAHAKEFPEQVEKAFMFGMYESRAEAFVRAVRNADAAKLPNRDLENMLNSYNLMIDASNAVTWSY